ncbi:MAG: hypothetical protein Q9168_006505 [Polycauliona sp. 1 TL-2023]
MPLSANPPCSCLGGPEDHKGKRHSIILADPEGVRRSSLLQRNVQTRGFAKFRFHRRGHSFYELETRDQSYGDVYFNNEQDGCFKRMRKDGVEGVIVAFAHETWFEKYCASLPSEPDALAEADEAAKKEAVVQHHSVPPRDKMHTPQEFSELKYERDLKMQEQAKAYRLQVRTRAPITEPEPDLQGSNGARPRDDGDIHQKGYEPNVLRDTRPCEMNDSRFIFPNRQNPQESPGAHDGQYVFQDENILRALDNEPTEDCKCREITTTKFPGIQSETAFPRTAPTSTKTLESDRGSLLASDRPDGPWHTSEARPSSKKRRADPSGDIGTQHKDVQASSPASRPKKRIRFSDPESLLRQVQRPGDGHVEISVEAKEQRNHKRVIHPKKGEGLSQDSNALRKASQKATKELQQSHKASPTKQKESTPDTQAKQQGARLEASTPNNHLTRLKEAQKPLARSENYEQGPNHKIVKGTAKHKPATAAKKPTSHNQNTLKMPPYSHPTVEDAEEPPQSQTTVEHGDGEVDTTNDVDGEDKYKINLIAFAQGLDPFHGTGDMAITATRWGSKGRRGDLDSRHDGHIEH